MLVLLLTPATISTTGSTDTVNRGYVGLKWTLGEGAMPAVVIGFRHANVESNGDTDGGDISFSFNVIGGLQAGQLRTKYFNGQENLQGEIGAGFDFSRGLFVGVGAKAPYSNLGIDYHFSPGSAWQPYFILDSLKKYDKPNPTTTLSCDDPFFSELNGDICLPGDR